MQVGKQMSMLPTTPCSKCGGDRGGRNSSYCLRCHAEYGRAYRAKNPEKCRLATLTWRRKNKDMVAAQNNRSKNAMRLKSRRSLGVECECCGERRESMLDIDHRNGGGSIERRRYGPSYVHKEIRKMSNPHEKYQLLCSNCNQSRRRLRGQCEHMSEAVEMLECMGR